MEARYMTDLEWRICHAVNIYVYRNGSDGDTPRLVHIPPAQKKSMRTVMDAVQERIKYPVGYAHHLYSMDGRKIRHPCELEMYTNYVVASNYDKHFKCVQYGRKRSPLLVLNRDSKHIRVLRLQNQNYDQWLIKKRGVCSERPQYIYPEYNLSQGILPQDLPVGQMGNMAGGLSEMYEVQQKNNSGGKTYRTALPNENRCEPKQEKSSQPQQNYQEQQSFQPQQDYQQLQNSLQRPNSQQQQNSLQRPNSQQQQSSVQRQNLQQQPNHLQRLNSQKQASSFGVPGQNEFTVQTCSIAVVPLKKPPKKVTVRNPNVCVGSTQSSSSFRSLGKDEVFYEVKRKRKSKGVIDTSGGQRQTFGRQSDIINANIPLEEEEMIDLTDSIDEENISEEQEISEELDDCSDKENEHEKVTKSSIGASRRQQNNNSTINAAPFESYGIKTTLNNRGLSKQRQDEQIQGNDVIKTKVPPPPCQYLEPQTSNFPASRNLEEYNSSVPFTNQEPSYNNIKYCAQQRQQNNATSTQGLVHELHQLPNSDAQYQVFNARPNHQQYGSQHYQNITIEKQQNTFPQNSSSSLDDRNQQPCQFITSDQQQQISMDREAAVRNQQYEVYSSKYNPQQQINPQLIPQVIENDQNVVPQIQHQYSHFDQAQSTEPFPQQQHHWQYEVVPQAQVTQSPQIRHPQQPNSADSEYIKQNQHLSLDSNNPTLWMDKHTVKQMYDLGIVKQQGPFGAFIFDASAMKQYTIAAQQPLVLPSGNTSGGNITASQSQLSPDDQNDAEVDIPFTPLPVSVNRRNERRPCIPLSNTQSTKLASGRNVLITQPLVRNVAIQMGGPETETEADDDFPQQYHPQYGPDYQQFPIHGSFLRQPSDQLEQWNQLAPIAPVQVQNNHGKQEKHQNGRFRSVRRTPNCHSIPIVRKKKSNASTQITSSRSTKTSDYAKNQNNPTTYVNQEAALQSQRKGVSWDIPSQHSIQSYTSSPTVRQKNRVQNSELSSLVPPQLSTQLHENISPFSYHYLDSNTGNQGFAR